MIIFSVWNQKPDGKHSNCVNFDENTNKCNFKLNLCIDVLETKF